MKTAFLGSLFALLLMFQVPAFGQQYTPAAYSNYQYPQTQCGNDCMPPAMAPPQQQPPQQQPTGYFAAPPQNGPVAGESRGYGVNGFAIHMPAMTLRLPTIEFPSLFRVRRNPHMMVDAAQAPYVQQAAVAQATAFPQQAAPPAKPAESPPQEQPPEPKDRPQAPPEQCAPPTPKCYPLPPPVPSHLRCDETFTHAPEQYYIQQLQERERQLQALQAQVDQLSQVTQQLVEMNYAQQQNRMQENAAQVPQLVNVPLESAQAATTRPLYSESFPPPQRQPQSDLRQVDYQRTYYVAPQNQR